MLNGRQVLGLMIGLVITLAAAGCGRASPNTTSNSKAKVQQVLIGMTVQQVDQILGKPLRIDTTPTLPSIQIRSYGGYKDQYGTHVIDITFDNGAVITVTDMIPRTGIW